MQIRDGKSMTSPLVGRYCGNNYGPFPVITSSGTYVLLQFVSDNTTDGNHLSGFTLLHTGKALIHNGVYNFFKTLIPWGYLLFGKAVDAIRATTA